MKRLQLTILLLFSLLTIVLGSESFECFKLIMYNTHGVTLGSQKASLNFLGSSHKISFDEDLVRSKATFLPYSELILRNERYKNGTYERLSIPGISEYQQAVAGGASALLIVIPKQIPLDQENTWREVELNLITNEFLIPVYFLYESEKLNTIIQDIEKSRESNFIQSANLLGSILNDDYRVIVSTKEPSLVKDTKTTNIQGWLGGRDSKSRTIVIVGNYDSLAAAPELGKSASSAISTSVIFELSRLFSKLYSNQRNHANYNILFLLTSGNNFNFYSSKSWLLQLDERLVNSIEFVLCLDSLLSGDLSDPIYLHTSRPEKDETARAIYSSFQKVAEQQGRKFELSINKINMSLTEEQWEHEQFAKQKILASTISTNKTPYPNLARSSVFDNNSRVNVSLVKENTKFIAESLAHFIFKLEGKGITIFQQSLEVDELILSSWLTTLDREERFVGSIKEDLVNGIEQVFSSYTTDVKKQVVSFDKNAEYNFYTSTGPTTLTISVAKPFVFDVILAILLTAYLSALYFGLKFFLHS